VHGSSNDATVTDAKSHDRRTTAVGVDREDVEVRMVV
jgi:hypothetical protein